jgi:hypothetical protein
MTTLNFELTKNKYIMYKVQDYDSVFFTSMLLTKLYVNVRSLLRCGKHLVTCMIALLHYKGMNAPIKLVTCHFFLIFLHTKPVEHVSILLFRRVEFPVRVRLGLGLGLGLELGLGLGLAWRK